MKTVGIVIVNWNGKENTLACLDSLVKSQISGSFKVVVVDNASSDGSVEIIKKKIPACPLD